MSKEGVSFKNRDRFIQLGIAISTLRKLRGMSQDQLAEKANMSRSHLSAIEAPNMIRSFSLETLFNLADALMITPSDLLNTSLFLSKSTILRILRSNSTTVLSLYITLSVPARLVPRLLPAAGSARPNPAHTPQSAAEH